MNKEGLNIDSTKWIWKEFLSIAQKITKDKNRDGRPDQYTLPKMSVEQMYKYIFADEYILIQIMTEKQLILITQVIRSME